MSFLIPSGLGMLAPDNTTPHPLAPSNSTGMGSILGNALSAALQKVLVPLFDAKVAILRTHAPRRVPIGQGCLVLNGGAAVGG